MPGCGSGNCACQTRTEAPRTGVSLAEAVAKVVVDGKVVRRAIELYESGMTTVQDLVVQITLEKSEGRL